MHHPNARLVLATVVCVGGLAFAVVSLLTNGRPAPEVVEFVDAPAAERLRQVETFSAFDASPEGHSPDIKTLSKELERRLASLDADGRGSTPESLSRVAAARLALFAFPSWESYASEASGLLSASGPDSGAEILPKEVWSKLASPFNNAEFAFDEMQVYRAPVDKSEMEWLSNGGRLTSTRASGMYDSETGKPKELYHVIVPIRLPEWRLADGPLKLMLVLSFRQRSTDGRWVPYMTSVYDPGREATALPAPWI